LLSLDNSATTLDDPDKTSPAKNDADWKDSGLLEFAESQKMLHLLSINGPTKMEQIAVVSRLKAQMTALNLLRKAAQECETRITKDKKILAVLAIQDYVLINGQLHPR